ncbi:MAG: hypothetical protein R2712_14575 [Vicinamibacterales bacterium]
MTPHRPATRPRPRASLAALLVLAWAAAPGGQSASAPRAWFGLMLPPPVGQHPAVLVGERAPRPVVVPPGDPEAPELSAAAIRADLDTIVGFAQQSRATKEIGSGQLWGRIAGFPSASRTVAWAIEQFTAAGIADVEAQPFEQAANAPFWLPLSWTLTLKGDPAFGPGSTDVVLDSAMPLAPSTLPSGGLTAPLVFVGSASPSLLAQIDVRGKIAVQLVVPQAHMVFERDPVVPRARALFERGAVAVVNVMRQAGNERAKDFSNCGGPCFNVGGRDGHFLEEVLDAAATAQPPATVRATLALQTETRTGLSAGNGVAVIRSGAPPDEVIVDAHVDARFGRAGDNADGLAVMVSPATSPGRRTSEAHAGVRGERGTPQPGAQRTARFHGRTRSWRGRDAAQHRARRAARFSPARSVGPDGYP